MQKQAQRIEPTNLMITVYCDGCQIDSQCVCRLIDGCIEELQLNAKLQVYTDTIQRLHDGIPLAPAISLNGRVLCMGTLLGRDSLIKLLQAHIRQHGPEQNHLPETQTG
ncbi:hypothetical protein IT575_09360 [bacterium]|nr:hypothetical protein [bacterium]